MKGRLRRPGSSCYSVRAYLQIGAPSPAAALTGFVVATEIPQVTPGSCGWSSVADQYDVLATIDGEPTPEVDENLDDSAAFVRSAYLFESVKKVSSAVDSDARSEIACVR